MMMGFLDQRFLLVDCFLSVFNTNKMIHHAVLMIIQNFLELIGFPDLKERPLCLSYLIK